MYNNYKSRANEILDLDRARIEFTRKDSSHFYNNGHENVNQTSPFLKLNIFDKKCKKKYWKTRKLNQGFTGSKHCTK